MVFYNFYKLFFLKIFIKEFKEQNKLIEAQRIEQRTNFDIEMMKETGFPPLPGIGI